MCSFVIFNVVELTIIISIYTVYFSLVVQSAFVVHFVVSVILESSL